MSTRPARSLLRFGRTKHTEPNGLSWIAGRIEVPDVANLLDLNDRPATVIILLGFSQTGTPLWQASVWHRLAEHAADEPSPIASVQIEDVRHGLAYVGVAGGCRIDKSLAKIWPRGATDDDRIGTTESAVHSLPLLQSGVGHLHGARQRVATTRGERAKIDDDCRNVRDR